MYSGVRLVAPPLMEFPIFSFLHHPRSPLCLVLRASPVSVSLSFSLVSLSRRLSVRLIDSRTSSRFSLVSLNVCPTSSRQTCLDVVFNPLIHFEDQNQPTHVILLQHTYISLNVSLLRTLCHYNLFFYNIRVIQSIIPRTTSYFKYYFAISWQTLCIIDILADFI